MKFLLMVILTEVFFISGGCLGRLYLMDSGNFFDLLWRPWLLNYLFSWTVGTLLMLYVLKTRPIMTAISLLAGTGLMMAVLFGGLFLGEPLDIRDGLSVVLILCSMYLLHQDKKKKMKKSIQPT